MKLITIIILAATTMLVIPAEQISIGDKAPKQDLELLSTDGNQVSLKDLNRENGLCVIYSCNTCPWVLAWEDRYNEIYKEFTEMGFVLVNSNEAKREGEDSMEQMKEHAKQKGYFNFAYVVDKNHELADAFGATKTPDVFLFNGDMELVYKGAIDDNSKNKTEVKEQYLMNAAKAVVAGERISPEETKALGCSIKRLKN